MCLGQIDQNLKKSQVKNNRNRRAYTKNFIKVDEGVWKEVISATHIRYRRDVYSIYLMMSSKQRNLKSFIELSFFGTLKTSLSFSRSSNNWITFLRTLFYFPSVFTNKCNSCMSECS
jgi:hypothetical protein